MGTCLSRADNPPRRRRVFRARDVVRRGLVTPEQLRGPAWQRIVRGVYADAILPLDHGLKAAATALVVPTAAALTGVSAAWLWGVRLASPADPVDVLCPPGTPLRSRTGLRVRHSPLPARDLDALVGIRVTTPLRTAWELALRLELTEAVVYLDALSGLERFDTTELDAYLAERSGRHGCRRAGRVFAMVDGRAESPQESRLRVRLVLAGLPAPVPQFEVRLRGEFVARVDLAWPEHRVAVEYDGRWHADPAQLDRDRARLNRLLLAGWHVHHVTAPAMRDLSPTIATLTHLLPRP